MYPYTDATIFHYSHNERNGVSNHRRLDYLLNPLFRHIKENIKALRHWPLLGESTGDRQRGKCFLLMSSSCFAESLHCTKNPDVIWRVWWQTPSVILHDEYQSSHVRNQSGVDEMLWSGTLKLGPGVYEYQTPWRQMTHFVNRYAAIAYWYFKLAWLRVP